MKLRSFRLFINKRNFPRRGKKEENAREKEVDVCNVDKADEWVGKFAEPFQGKQVCHVRLWARFYAFASVRVSERKSFVGEENWRNHWRFREESVEEVNFEGNRLETKSVQAPLKVIVECSKNDELNRKIYSRACFSHRSRMHSWRHWGGLP